MRNEANTSDATVSRFELCTDENISNSALPSAWFLTIDTYIPADFFKGVLWDVYKLLDIYIYGCARFELPVMS